MFSVLRPERGSTGSGMRRRLLERVQQLVDGRLAQLRIGRVGHLAGRGNFVAQRAFGAERQPVLGGLAVDQVARAARVAGGGHSAGAVALLADHEQQAEVAHARVEQRFERRESWRR